MFTVSSYSTLFKDVASLYSPLHCFQWEICCHPFLGSSVKYINFFFSPGWFFKSSSLWLVLSNLIIMCCGLVSSGFLVFGVCWVLRSVGLWFSPNLETVQLLFLCYSFCPPRTLYSMSLGTPITHIFSKLMLCNSSMRAPSSRIFCIFSLLLSLALLPSQKRGTLPPVPRLYLYLDSMAHSPIISWTSPQITTCPISFSLLLPWPKKQTKQPHIIKQNTKITN